MSACRRCNHVKADRNIADLGWRLRRTPRVPNGAVWRIVSTGRMDPRWRRYLAVSIDDEDSEVFGWDDDSADFAEPASA